MTIAASQHMRTIHDHILASVCGGTTSPAQRFKISSWVNDMFELTSPRNMSGPPRGASSMEHWKSNPSSGITGTVYRAVNHIFYDASRSWFNMGKLPRRLR